MPSPTIVVAQDEPGAIDSALKDEIAVMQASLVPPIYTYVYTADNAVKKILGRSCRYTTVTVKGSVSILKFVGNQVACLDDLARLSASSAP
ncbi:MAG: hypothetical protein HZC01_04070 [Candidatus Kerfeldbacteria bacterium]|nr:hypothetical protein [Candidatus Kerfeldbacteria bacterium]